MPPPPSRPRYNQNNDIETNQISNNGNSDNGNGYAPKDRDKQNTSGFFVDVPPKFFMALSPAKQQYYLQQHVNELIEKHFHDKNVKFNVIAFKDKYRNVPYYVVSVRDPMINNHKMQFPLNRVTIFDFFQFVSIKMILG